MDRDLWAFRICVLRSAAADSRTYRSFTRKVTQLQIFRGTWKRKFQKDMVSVLPGRQQVLIC